MNISSIICESQSYQEWRGEVVNILLVIVFLVAIALNITFGLMIAYGRIRNKGNTRTLLIILEVVLGNLFVAGAQLFNTLIRLYSTYQCYQKIIFYLTHQIGMQLTSSAILALTYLNYLMVSQNLPTTQTTSVNVVSKLLCQQGISIIIGVFFILLPTIIESKFSFVVSLFYETILGFISILVCRKCKKELSLLNQYELEYTDKLKKDEYIVRIFALITTSLKLFTVVLNVVIASNKLSFQALIALKFASTSLYLFPCILPIVYFRHFMIKININIQCTNIQCNEDPTIQNMEDIQ